jgi:hypothetical protein
MRSRLSEGAHAFLVHHELLEPTKGHTFHKLETNWGTALLLQTYVFAMVWFSSGGVE